MFRLVSKQFADYFRQQPETGMGYWVVDAYLKDGKVFRQVVVNSGYVTKARGYEEIPFTEADVERFEVTHDKWKC